MDNNSTLTASTIRNILTLRYDPSLKPNLPKNTWKDFIEGETSPSTDFIENSIQNSIKKTIGNSDIENISIALSGGVDSTLILTLLKNLFPEISIDAISIKFADSIDESTNAAKIAEHFDVKHHIIHIDNYLKELPQAINIIKLPFWDLHWYYVVKKAQSLSKYLASGDGGDEIFGGYTFRYKKFMTLTNSESTPKDKVKAYLQCHERDRVPDQEQLFEKKSCFSWDDIYQILLPYFDNSLEPLRQVFLADYNGKLLYNFNPVNTLIHDFFKIKSITPLLSSELISYGNNIPSRFKYDPELNVGKILLRKILQKYNMESFLTEKKLGFSVNTVNLWQNYGHDICKYYLQDSMIVKEGWISKNWIQKYIDKNDLDVLYINKFLGLLAFEIWYRLFITNEMRSDEKLEL